MGSFRAWAKCREVIKLDDGLALIYDLEKFLSVDETAVLDKVMNEKAAGGA